MDKNFKKSTGTLVTVNLSAGADFFKHEVVTAMKIVRIIQWLASDAVR